MKDQALDQQTGTVEEESIFQNTFDTEPYAKSMRNGRRWLYAVAVLQLLMGIYEYSTVEDHTVGIIAFGINAIIAFIFLVLALWSRKQPVTAFTAALIFYVAINLGFMFLDSSNILRGILIKIFIVIALVKANKDSRKYQEIKTSLGQGI